VYAEEGRGNRKHAALELVNVSCDDDGGVCDVVDAHRRGSCMECDCIVTDWIGADDDACSLLGLCSGTSTIIMICHVIC
jgi:hypothetical protein